MVALLQERIAVFEKTVGQDSLNSSKPPSSDGVGPRKKRAERRAEARVVGRKPGKQPGAPGAHLRRRDPDETTAHVPVCCGGCGSGLDEAVVVGTEVRQVIDLIPARVHVAEHVVESRRCRCGLETAGVFPAPARAAACWGPEVRALALYLMDRQHLPVTRCAELLSDVLGAPVSTGWLCSNTLNAALIPFATWTPPHRYTPTRPGRQRSGSVSSQPVPQRRSPPMPEKPEYQPRLRKLSGPTTTKP